MKRPSSKARHRRLFFAGIAVLGGSVAVACTYDFHTFDPAGPGGGGDEGGTDNPDAPFQGGDGSAQRDGANGGEAGTCNDASTCLNTGAACGSDCAKKQDACKKACAPLDLGCPTTCTNNFNTCKSGCYDKCYTCSAGCEDPAVCRAVVDGDGGT